jgi:hypothetical protein
LCRAVARPGCSQKDEVFFGGGLTVVTKRPKGCQRPVERLRPIRAQAPCEQHSEGQMSPASGMGPLCSEFRQQHGTTGSPVMGPPWSIHQRRRR